MGAEAMQARFIEQTLTLEDFETESPRFARLIQRLRRAAESECTATLVGEPGTGKTMLTQALHNASGRKGKPFRWLSLGEIRPELAASELFGHVRGAFTGATANRQGLFRAAEGGTLFIDEVGAAPVEVQAALLAAIEYRQVRPLGSDEPVKVDVRLVLASSVPPDRMRGDASRWLPEFVDRIDSVVIEVPPLRERGEDIPSLTARIVREIGQRDRRRVPRLSAGLLTALRDRHWPGNVRELRAVLESALLECEEGELLAEHLLSGVREPRGDSALVQKLDEVIGTAAARAMEYAEGSRRRAAALLGISRSRLDRILDDGIVDEPGEPEGRPGSIGEDVDP